MHLDLVGLADVLHRHNQQHLLSFWSTLRDEEKQDLLRHLKTIDFDRLEKMYKQTVASADVVGEAIDKLMKPVPAEAYGGVNRNSPEELADFHRKGLEAISRGEVAVVLLAGGQGTRLGVSYPKGMYNIGLPSGKTLYQIQAERIRRLEDLSEQQFNRRGSIPWYIMTSEHTKHATEEFFASHHYFGLSPDAIKLFEQEMIPCFDFSGKIILESRGKIATAPGGNGGLYRALVKEGILSDLKRRGVKFVHVCGVDNVLVKMADPHFVGYCVSKNVECGNKVVSKKDPNEPVGVVCLVQGIWQVVEYSEILPETAQCHHSDGNLMFDAGNIANHFFTLDFLDSVCNEHEPELAYHIAKKKIPYVDLEGNLVKPAKPNGIKMEKFVFDVFQFARRFAVWEVIRKDEFSPLKNADGSAEDTPTTARNSLYGLHARYVVQGGGQFVDEAGHLLDGNVEEICEISPLVSYAGEGLEELVQGKRFEYPLILASAHEDSVRFKL